MFGKLLHGRGGESLVEVLVAIVVFLVLMGTLCAGTRFASGALMRAETIRDSVVQFQESLRRNLAEGNMTAGRACSILAAAESRCPSGFCPFRRWRGRRSTRRRTVGPLPMRKR